MASTHRSNALVKMWDVRELRPSTSQSKHQIILFRCAFGHPDLQHERMRDEIGCKTILHTTIDRSIVGRVEALAVSMYNVPCVQVKRVNVQRRARAGGSHEHPAPLQTQMYRKQDFETFEDRRIAVVIEQRRTNPFEHSLRQVNWIVVVRLACIIEQVCERPALCFMPFTSNDIDWSRSNQTVGDRYAHHDHRVKTYAKQPDRLVSDLPLYGRTRSESYRRSVASRRAPIHAGIRGGTHA